MSWGEPGISTPVPSPSLFAASVRATSIWSARTKVWVPLSRVMIALPFWTVYFSLATRLEPSLRTIV